MAAAYFVDSSALVKRYVQETGTPWVRGITRRRPSTVVYIARITTIEVSCSIARRRQGKSLTPPHAASILRRFRQHLDGRYIIAELTIPVLDEARRLGVKHALRGYDAVQLAAALEVNRFHQAGGSGPLTLVSADLELNAAAAAEGLVVDDPNNHP